MPLGCDSDSVTVKWAHPVPLIVLLSLSHPFPKIHPHHFPPIDGGRQGRPANSAMAKLCFLLIVSFAVVAASAAMDDDAAAAAASDPENKCVYTIYVRTGSIWKGGTDSVIGVTLLGADGSGVRIRDLERWGGLMGSGHDYYERGNLDIFSGRGPCMRQAPCRMNLTSDGTGPHHGWYCNYLEATVTGPHLGCAQQLFTVEQWLATDAPPYRLYAVVDNCSKAKDDDAAAAADDGDEPRVTVL